MNKLFTEQVHIVKGISPMADIYNGNPITDVVNMKQFERAAFVLFQKTAGTNTGVAVVTIECSAAADGSSATAIPFKHRKLTTGASDALSVVTNVAATGYTTTANEDTIHVFEVEAADLEADKPYLFARLTESVNDPVTGCVVINLFDKNIEPSATALV